MSIFTQIAAAPLNSLVIAINSIIWFVMWNRRMGFDAVALSYRKVIVEKQYYRVVTATFTHLDVIHILFNMGTLYSVWILEATHGSVWYVETTLLLLVAKAGMWLGMTHVLVTKLGRSQHADASAVGYSGVLFGWITLMSLYDPTLRIPLPGGFSFPIALAPFAQLLFTQLIIPRASFMGHLSGILGGYLVGWGAFDWLRGYWSVMITLWFATLCLLSLRANAALPGWIARWVYVSPEYCATTMAAALADDNGESFGTSIRRFMRNGVLHVARPVASADIIDAPNAIRSVSGAGGAQVQAETREGIVRGEGEQERRRVASPASPGRATGGSGARAQPHPPSAVEIEMPRRGAGASASASVQGRRGQQAGSVAQTAGVEDVDLSEDEEAGLPLMAARGGPGPTSSASGELILGAAVGADGAAVHSAETHAPGRPSRISSAAAASSASLAERVSDGVRNLLQSVGMAGTGFGMGSSAARSSPAPSNGTGPGGVRRGQSRLVPSNAVKPVPRRRQAGDDADANEEEGGEEAGDAERRRLI